MTFIIRSTPYSIVNNISNCFNLFNLITKYGLRGFANGLYKSANSSSITSIVSITYTLGRKESGYKKTCFTIVFVLSYKCGISFAEIQYSDEVQLKTCK